MKVEPIMYEQDVNPYDSKAYKRTERFLEYKRRKPIKNTNPYDLSRREF
jgi:hypothetical protein